MFCPTFLVTVATPTLRVSDVFDLQGNNHRLCCGDVSLKSLKRKRLLPVAVRKGGRTSGFRK